MKKWLGISQKTKSLFWLNVKGVIFQSLGWFLILISLFIFFFSWIVAIILIGVSIFLLIKGHQQRLEFKLKSGYIVYNGGR